MLWINEGTVLNDAGTLITTIYVDLREETNRIPIASLVKGCRREHALEDGRTVLISKPKVFQEYGDGLIRDEQEGIAKVEDVTEMSETPAQILKRRASQELNDADEFLNSGVRLIERVEYKTIESQSKKFEFGEDYWIYCTSIKPSSDSERDAWGASLDECYDHVSEIGQPAKFAQALARMVAEQIGPLGKEAWMTGTFIGDVGARTTHKHQLVIHGPVVYTDRQFDMIAFENDEVKKLANYFFTKRTTHAAQQEYRFIVLNGGSTQQTVSLEISGMMRDALRPVKDVLIRPTPSVDDKIGEDSFPLPRDVKTSTTLLNRQKTTSLKEKQTEEIWHEARTQEGQLISSDVNRVERVYESITTQDIDLDDGEFEDSQLTEKIEELSLDQSDLEINRDFDEHSDENSDDTVAKHIAIAECSWNDGHSENEMPKPDVNHGIDHIFKSLEDKIKEILSDPTVPMKSTAETEISVCTPAEIVKIHGIVATLASKILIVAAEHKRDAASACWYASRCIVRIYARFGDIVDSVWIEKERFVVIRIKGADVSGATGRIVVTPSGGYTYCFKNSNNTRIIREEGLLGDMFFPLDNDIEIFKSFGWSPKKI